MPVTVRLPGPVVHDERSRTLEADGATVREVLSAVALRYPQVGTKLHSAGGGISPYVALYLNNVDVRCGGGLETQVVDGDELQVILAVAGG
jgi:molybdopterin converting factor small subunit